MVKLPGFALAAAVAFAGNAPHRQNWDLRQFNWVRLVPQEKGAEPNAHPARLDAEALKGLLAAVTFDAGGAQETLFSREDLNRFAGPIAEALSLADPGEDVAVFCTSRRGAGLLAPDLTVTARVFMKGEALNLLVQETRLDYAGRARANAAIPLPSYGSRTAAGGASIQAPGAAPVRADWVAFPGRAIPAPRPDESVRVVPLQAPAPRGAAEERLRTLKRLREENLITEEEYQEKRKAVLKEL
jgi:hypothetical protein